MKKFYTFSLVMLLSGSLSVFAQNVNNAGFENWENVGSATEEPNDWNSFKTAGGALASFAAQQIIRSSVVRPGTTGQYSALIWSRSTMSIVANGNMTTGKINMGNVDPGNAANYNESITTDAAFSEAFTASPDSIVFWARFKPASGSTSDSGRMRAVIHDNYNYRDPNASDVNAPNHIVATATAHFVKTNDQWLRVATAFDNSGPATSREFILITFTTNKTAGGGSAGDSLYIDDLEFVYGGVSIMEPENNDQFSVLADASTNQLVVNFGFDQTLNTQISIFSIAGQLIQQREKSIGYSSERFELSTLISGIYLVDVRRADGSHFSQKIAVR